MEVWKKVKGFESYEVSNLGRLISLKGKEPKVLIGGVNKGGYKCYNIRNENKTYFKTIHRLVAIAFLENNNNLDFVNHINKDKKNNKVDNLEWCNSRENNTHMKLSFSKSSKYVGVYFDKSRGKYYSTIKFNGKQNFLGIFTIEEEARDAYNNALIKNNLTNRYASNNSI